MRTDASNASLKNRLKANRMDRKAWEVNCLKPYPWTIMAKPLRKIGQFFWTKATIEATTKAATEAMVDSGVEAVGNVTIRQR
ncbi:hypothetical protein DSECCO2_477380 [anaerobic digester metagenome]